MGVGFKSVFERFRQARVSGFGWCFKFDVGTRGGDLGATVTEWFDTLLPSWDDEAAAPDDGYTTAFRLARPIDRARPALTDLERLASPDDPTPLAVLALRGLEQVRVGEIVWDLSVDTAVVEIRCSSRETLWRWKSFVATYRPDDDAMRRFLEVRQETQDQLNDDGERVERQVVGFLPLDEDGLPNPPDHGRVYATLPTQVQVPFGFHLQADWLVNVDRHNLREVEADPWQEAIVRQVPEIVRQLLTWLTVESDAAISRGYAALRDPGTQDGFLSAPLGQLRDEFVARLADHAVVPIHGAGAQGFCLPADVARLPERFREGFGGQPQWRPDLLFGCNLMDEELLGGDAIGFAVWLGWGRSIGQNDIPWTKTLPRWWSALPKDQRTDALFALWRGVAGDEWNWDDPGWNDAPVVPTESRKWVPANRTRWLNEEAPNEREPGGPAVAGVLADLVPCADERVPPRLRIRVNRADNEGTRWLKRQHQEVTLASLVGRACDEAEDPDDLPLVDLLEWALSRGDRRQDLVPLVHTEDGAREPADALLADPLVEGGGSRRKLFPDNPALIAAYAAIGDRRAVVLFLERLGVRGAGKLDTKSTHVWSSREAAERIGVDEWEVQPAKSSGRDAGYTVIDHAFPFEVDEIPADALQYWLSHEHACLHRRGTRSARSSYYGTQYSPGRKPASWVSALQEHPWLLCKDGVRRKPADVLLAPDPDFEDAAIAVIDADLAPRLAAEGVRFGAAIPRSPVLRRLARRGTTDMPDGELASLLREARRHVATGEATQADLRSALDSVELKGVSLVSRVVRRSGTGSGLRSDLGGWVIALSSVDPELAEAVSDLPLSLPETTTGEQALDFLKDVWERQPGQVDAIRGQLAAAYRYVLEDAQQDADLAGAWRNSRARARLYGRRRWHPVGPNLAVDDIQSPLIHQFLTAGRVAVASAHLGDTNEQVSQVATALGVGLLSSEVEVRQGARTHDPPWIELLRLLVRILASLDDRRPLDGIAFCNALTLWIGGERHRISAYVDDGTLMLVGDPETFAVEAAGQLVDYFHLSQRGNEVAWLTGALFVLGDRAVFLRHLQVLADGLGVDLSKVPQQEEQDARIVDPDASGDTEPSGWLGAADSAEGDKTDIPADAKGDVAAGPSGDLKRRDKGTSSRTGGPAAQSGNVAPSGASGGARSFGDRKTTATTASKARSTGDRAADHFGLLLVKRDGLDEPGSNDEHSIPKDKRNDRKARSAVIHYERHEGRRAEAMDDNQPGFDVRSVDESTGRCRRIEVKGVQGIFKADASVVLSARQVHDAVQSAEDGVEYWLYVVDSTETSRPRVFPIPWARRPARLRYGFYASAWADDAERAAVATETEFTPLLREPGNP